MENLGVFDIIGPNMIGPSSSHTAGALRISLLAGKMVKGSIKSVEFKLYGSFARTYKGHGTDRALIAGILGYNTDDKRIKDAFYYAQKQGLNYSFKTDFEKKEVHPNTVDIIITNDQNQTTTITGISVGGGRAIIQKINNAQISLSGEYNTIFTTQRDTPGVVAYITSCLSDCRINIAFMKLFREKKGEIAYTVIESDEIIPKSVIDKIEKFVHIKSAVLIQI